MTDDDIYSEPPPLMDVWRILRRGRGSFVLQIMNDDVVREEIAFSNAGHLLHWQQGELQGPRIVREHAPAAEHREPRQLPAPDEPEASLVTRIGRAAGLKRGTP